MQQTFLGTGRRLRDTVLAGTYGTAPEVVTPMAIVSRSTSGLEALLACAVAVPAGLALATDRLDRVSRLGRARVAVPWGTALTVLTAVVAFSVLTVDPTDRATTPLTTAFPFLVAATVAMLVIRATPGCGRAAPPGPVVPGDAALPEVTRVRLTSTRTWAAPARRSACARRPTPCR